jgi:hypothetical protein
MHIAKTQGTRSAARPSRRVHSYIATAVPTCAAATEGSEAF